MKTLELEQMNLRELTLEESRTENGGFISIIVSIHSLVRGVAEYLVQEGADIVQGIPEGYNAARGN